MKKHGMTILKIALIAGVVGYIALFAYNSSYHLDPPREIKKVETQK